MTRTAGIAAAAVIGFSTITLADAYVEFSLYTTTDWEASDRAYDVTMLIEGIDLMGDMPEGPAVYDAVITVTGEDAFGGLPIPITFEGQIDGSLWQSEMGWGDLGFTIPEDAFAPFYSGGGPNAINMAWSLDDSDPDNISYSYGMATLEGTLASSIGVDVLYLYDIVETTVPTPGALALLGMAVVGRRRRRS